MTRTHPTPTTTGADVPIASGEQLLTVPGSAQTIAGITIPDTPLVRDVTALIREAEEDLLFDHSRRVFLFGALQGRRRGLQPDLELLYVGAMFHDIGLTQRSRKRQPQRSDTTSCDQSREGTSLPRTQPPPKATAPHPSGGHSSSSTPSESPWAATHARTTSTNSHRSKPSSARRRCGAQPAAPA